MNEKDNKKSIHLIWFYIILIVLTVFFSALFSLLKLQTVDYTVSSNLRTQSPTIIPALSAALPLVTE